MFSTDFQKRLALLLVLSLLLVLCACSAQQARSLEIPYGESFDLAPIVQSSSMPTDWTSADKEIAVVESGVIRTVSPGRTRIVGSSNGKVISTLDISVITIPAEKIILSSDKYEIVDGCDYQITYVLLPDNASDFGFTWNSSDLNVAEVSQDGTIHALAPGLAAITVSNSDGLSASCLVNVTEKSAYDLLSDNEKAFVDTCLKYLDDFRNPDSVVIKAISGSPAKWTVKVSAQNGFGGLATSVYWLDKASGFYNWHSYDIDIDISITPDSSYNVALINQAIEEKR